MSHPPQSTRLHLVGSVSWSIVFGLGGGPSFWSLSMCTSSSHLLLFPVWVRHRPSGMCTPATLSNSITLVIASPPICSLSASDLLFFFLYIPAHSSPNPLPQPSELDTPRTRPLCSGFSSASVRTSFSLTLVKEPSLACAAILLTLSATSATRGELSVMFPLSLVAFPDLACRYGLERLGNCSQGFSFPTAAIFASSSSHSFLLP